jgi:hypothetical protein
MKRRTSEIGHRTSAWFVVGLVVALGCDIPEQPLGPAERHLLVHAVLDPEGAEQHVRLDWSDGSPRGLTPPATEVTLIHPGGHETPVPRVTFSHAEMYSFTPQNSSERIQRCGTYGLRILDHGKVVTGTTTVPCPTTLSIMPSHGFSRGRDTLRLSWPRVPGAKAYYIAVQNRFTSNPIDEGFSYFYSTFADTSIVWPGNMRTLDDEPMFMTGANTTIVVSAADDNFYTYYHAQVDPFAGAPPSRLEGGIGVFGSLVPILRQGLTIVP